MGVTVCSERSSCPCLCSGVVWLAHGKCEVVAQYHVQTAHEIFKVWLPRKEKYRPRSAAMILSGEVSGKMNRVCCGAVNLSGTIHGEAVFKMNTTTSCGKVQTNPQEQWDLQEKYHCV